MNDWDELIKLAREVESTIKIHPGGSLNSEAIQAIRLLCSKMSWINRDASIGLKIKSIERLSDELYSPRKHLKYKKGYTSGADELKGRIFSDTRGIENLADMHKSSGNKAEDI